MASDNGCNQQTQVMSRRTFLLAGASIVALTTLNGVAANFAVKNYHREKIAKIQDLAGGEPITFNYPTTDIYSNNILVALDEEAGSGIGPDKNIIAFNQLCTHMGGPLQGTYKREHGALGPCPFHLTTFDLSRHGMVISGHATESLPQIMLELEGDSIYATGVMGLVYGQASTK